MKKSKVLILVTSQSNLGLTRKKTGFFLNHVTHPLFELERAEWLVDIASIQGGAAPLDENSRDLSDPINRDYFERKTFQHRIANTLAVSAINPSLYAAVILAGGYGALWDFPGSKELTALVAAIYKNGGVVGAIGEGAAGILSISSNRKITGTTTNEVIALGLTDCLPFSIESEASRLGVTFISKSEWQKNIVLDSRMVTGQNSMAAQAVGESVLRRLQMFNDESHKRDTI